MSFLPKKYLCQVNYSRQNGFEVLPGVSSESLKPTSHDLVSVPVVAESCLICHLHTGERAGN